jgi:hypothetical protein
MYIAKVLSGYCKSRSGCCMTQEVVVALLRCTRGSTHMGKWVSPCKAQGGCGDVGPCDRYGRGCSGGTQTSSRIWTRVSCGCPAARRSDCLSRRYYSLLLGPSSYHSPIIRKLQLATNQWCVTWLQTIEWTRAMFPKPKSTVFMCVRACVRDIKVRRLQWWHCMYRNWNHVFGGDGPRWFWKSWPCLDREKLEFFFWR